PLCDPDHLSEQIEQSLERLGLDRIDLYLMHRDNVRFGVGDFLGVLEDHRRAGRLRSYGASNWTLERLQEARHWAAAHDAQGFTAVSNNLSLARMVSPPWSGCVDARSEAWGRWLAETGTPLLPWSSQAQGFFARADPEDRSDTELVRCWYAPDNFERLARAKELARDRGVEPTAIALAWVLQQPFGTFPLIGPLAPAETRASVEALSVRLTPEEVAWLA
ncbi:MAG: aldo/keto reductase, partial [Candidatus Dormibacteraeota bacterium]|nr:aldo/keto reductase [Candidatus Dormibacteraeota bacterium]